VPNEWRLLRYELRLSKWTDELRRELCDLSGGWELLGQQLRLFKRKDKLRRRLRGYGQRSEELQKLRERLRLQSKLH